MAEQFVVVYTEFFLLCQSVKYTGLTTLVRSFLNINISYLGSMIMDDFIFIILSCIFWIVFIQLFISFVESQRNKEGDSEAGRLLSPMYQALLNTSNPYNTDLSYRFLHTRFICVLWPVFHSSLFGVLPERWSVSNISVAQSSCRLCFSECSFAVLQPCPVKSSLRFNDYLK